MSSTIRTIVLLGFLSIFLIFIGSFIGGRQGLYIAFIFSLLLNGVAYFFSDRIALASSGAKPISEKEAPKLYSMIRDLAGKADIPMPKIYITPALQANAFATGRDPNHASVAVTKGLLQSLSGNEVKAVLAHELAHVKNRDILIVSVAAVLASSISFLSRIGLYGSYGNEDRRNSSGGLAFLFAIFGPLAAMLVQFALSRQREFSADETGAKYMGTGEPLARALLAINDSTKRAPMRNMNPAFSSLYIGNPFGGMGGFVKLFSTHPPVGDRVKRLRKIK